MVAPGKYTVSLSKQIDGVVTKLSEPVEFTVEQLRKGALDGATADEVVVFWKELDEMQGMTEAASFTLGKAIKRVEAMTKALAQSNDEPGELNNKLHNLKMEILDLESEFYGNKVKSKVGVKNNPTVYSRMGVAQTGTNFSTYGPTPTHKRSLELAKKQFASIKIKIEEIVNEKIPTLEKDLINVGAPWIEGQPLP